MFLALTGFLGRTLAPKQHLRARLEVQSLQSEKIRLKEGGRHNAWSGLFFESNNHETSE